MLPEDSGKWEKNNNNNFGNNINYTEEDSRKWVFLCYSLSVKANLRHWGVWPRVAKTLIDNLLSSWFKETGDRAKVNTATRMLGLGEYIKGWKQKSRTPNTVYPCVVNEISTFKKKLSYNRKNSTHTWITHSKSKADIAVLLTQLITKKIFLKSTCV